MKVPGQKSHAAFVEYIPCVLRLSKHKFACYVEIHIDHVPPLNPAFNNVKIASRRKEARRIAETMCRLHRDKKLAGP